MSLVAPLQLSTTPDYTVDADIQYLRHSDAGSISGMASFGVVVRAKPDGSGGYGVGHCVAAGIFSCASGESEANVAGIWDRTDLNNPKALATVPFTAQAGVIHHIRVIVKENTITAKIDDGPPLNATDNAYLQGGEVGLWADRTQISVLRYEVSPA